MTQNQSKQKLTVWNSIIILFSIIGLVVCIAVLFPQVRLMILDYAGNILHKGESIDKRWFESLSSFALGGIFLILLLDYCMLTDSGRTLVGKVKTDIKDCLSEIDFHSFQKPVLILFVIYLLGILSIIRANFTYNDDVFRSVTGSRGWYDWSRYFSEFSSILVHGNANLMDISPLPQLLAVLILSISSVFLVYIIGNKKITLVKLLASIPLGLSPFFLECLSYKYDAPYMSLSILASIVPFLFISHKKAFLFCSVVVLLITCMTYQAAVGIYLLIVIFLNFQDWNSRRKSNKEILTFTGIAILAFFLAMLLFKFFLMRSFTYEYASTATYPVSQLFSGILTNLKNYVITVNQDLSTIWKIGILLVLLFFVTNTTVQSSQKKLISFFLSIFVVCVSFLLSFGMYMFLAIPLFAPRALIGFGVFLAIICIYAVSKKPAIVVVLTLNWCLFVFAFSYGNALADQKRYAEFRIGILLHDLSVLYPNRTKEEMRFQLHNSIDYTPAVKNVAKQNPIIKKLVPKRLGKFFWDEYYLIIHFNYATYFWKEDFIDFEKLNLPLVMDSYYHTIQSDGEHVLITLKR